MLSWRNRKEWRVRDWLGREWHFRALDPDEIDFANVPFDLLADPEEPIHLLLDQAFNRSGAKEDQLASQLIEIYDRLTGRYKGEEVPRPTDDPLGRLRGFKPELERWLCSAYEMGWLKYERIHKPIYDFPIEDLPPKYEPLPAVQETETFIGVRVVDQDGLPVRRRTVRIDGDRATERELITDVQGQVHLDALAEGMCRVTLLDVDHRDVLSPSARAAAEEKVAGGVRSVRQGETAPSVAAAAGFLWSDTVWLAQENKDLRDRRPDPNVLLPGDELFVPDRTPPAFSLPTGAKHTLTLRVTKLKIRLRLIDWLGRARSSEDCVVSYGDADDLPLTTDDSGKLSFDVPADVGTAQVACASGDTFVLSIGGLNPVDTLTGVGGRLRNLGFYWTVPDSADDALDDRLGLTFGVELFADTAQMMPSDDSNDAFANGIRKEYGT